MVGPSCSGWLTRFKLVAAYFKWPPADLWNLTLAELDFFYDIAREQIEAANK